MAQEKTYTIIKHRRNGQTETIGTLAELTKNYGYTLESGNSYNSKISLAPRTAKNLVNNLNKCVSVLQANSFNPDYYELKESK